MSQAQERRRAETWEAQHKKTHEESIKALEEMKMRMDAMDPSSAEHASLKANYEVAYNAAKDFFMKFHET